MRVRARWVGMAGVFGLAALAVLGQSVRAAEAPATSPQSEPPRIVGVDTVAPDVIGITVAERRAITGVTEPYASQPGDKIGEGAEPRVSRDGQVIGTAIGSDHRLLRRFDQVVGERLDTAWADAAASYAISSADDERYRSARAPAAVYRKSRPTDMVGVAGEKNNFDAPVEHRLYLRLPEPLRVGATYRIAFTGGPLEEQTFAYDPARLRSEAVHVNQVGFRPDDAVKIAFLSCWLGSGGPLSYGKDVAFHVLDDATARPVYEGRATLAAAAGDTSLDSQKRDYNGTDVYLLDFSSLKQPGTYRVCVEGVGCSYPFAIADDVWRRAFQAAGKGIFHYRNGIAFGPPYTTWTRPLSFNPEAGWKTIEGAAGFDEVTFDKKQLRPQNLDGPVIPGVWGGHKDAGDWQHLPRNMLADYYLLDLVLMAPDYFKGVSLNIPESGNGLPDAVNEALYGLELWHRMQTPEGGVRGGWQPAATTLGGGSWTFDPRVMIAYRPDVWSSYVYAAVAGRAALCLERWDKQRAAVYRESALRAMRWAEERWPDYAYRDKDQVRHDRAMVAAELFRLTGDAAWHATFKDSFRAPKEAPACPWQEMEPAWVYARTDRPDVDPKLQQQCRDLLTANADYALRWVDRTAFGWAKRADWFPLIGCAGSPSFGPALVRAHLLTGGQKYLDGAVRTCQTGLGGNPVNMCYTARLGQHNMMHPMNFDLLASHQPCPEGITVPGPLDLHYLISNSYFRKGDQWVYWVIGKYAYPDLKEWPPIESYFDVSWLPTMHEDMVQAAVSCNAYTWGYLAARAKPSPTE